MIREYNYEERKGNLEIDRGERGGRRIWEWERMIIMIGDDDKRRVRGSEVLHVNKFEWKGNVQRSIRGTFDERENDVHNITTSQFQ